MNSSRTTPHRARELLAGPGESLRWDETTDAAPNDHTFLAGGWRGEAPHPQSPGLPSATDVEGCWDNDTVTNPTTPSVRAGWALVATCVLAVLLVTYAVVAVHNPFGIAAMILGAVVMVLAVATALISIRHPDLRGRTTGPRVLVWTMTILAFLAVALAVAGIVYGVVNR